MKRGPRSLFYYNLREHDRSILRGFYFWVAVVYSIMGLILVFQRRFSFGDIINALLTGLVIIFFLTGIRTYYCYKTDGIIPTQRLKFLFLLIAAPPAFLLVIYLFTSTDLFFDLGMIRFLLLFVIATLLFYLLFFFLGYGFLIAGFGVIGFMSLLLRGMLPNALLKIKGITPITHEKKKVGRGRHIEVFFHRWVFNIPHMLDTRTLTISNPPKRDSFPWRHFKLAFMWEIFFGIILFVNISLNPILLEAMTVDQLFSIASNVSILIPALILPWFVFYHLDARIAGPTEDFKLYSGLRSRTFGALVAVGTLLIIIRIAMREMDSYLLIRNFVTFLITYLPITAIFSYVYFNYFEDGLAHDVIKRYRTYRHAAKSAVDEELIPTEVEQCGSDAD